MLACTAHFSLSSVPKTWFMSCAASKTTYKQSTTFSDVSSFPLKSANSAVKKRPEKSFVSDPASSEIQASVPADGSA